MKALYESHNKIFLLSGIQLQELSLNFHMKCEQFAHFANGSFFNFDGTAGMRISMKHLQRW